MIDEFIGSLGDEKCELVTRLKQAGGTKSSGSSPTDGEGDYFDTYFCLDFEGKNKIGGFI